MARLKIATFNINGIRARLGALLEWLEREKPDIACLQELKAPDEAFPQADVERLGYGALWHGQKSWNGVAILARGTQPEERQRGLPDDPDGTQSRYLEADVHGLRVACLYLPNGNPWPGPKFEYKLRWFAELQRRAKTLLDGGAPTVMCGDFNVVPTDELDIYNPASWRKDALLQPESREAWFELLAQGWTDSIRAVHGDARIYTFWDYFRKHWERDAGLRIDHLLLSPTLAPLLKDAGVDRWVRGQPGASDHAPTWVVLDTGGAGTAAAKRAARKTAAPSAGGGRAPGLGARKTAAKGKDAASSGARGAVAGASPTSTGKTAKQPRAKKAIAKKAVAKKAVAKKAVGKKTAPSGAKRKPAASAARKASLQRAGSKRTAH
ncbi:exodeoxyribonuclease III [Cognatilysobacter segetis]|uniref:exodeoxyribonuclease III n=1 Tax=Cognatilysobacter segetis TaxID=2492394 RepID=UPI00105F1F36|nr:exodeoxyribonuclease III [Lysobacter segetis]